MQQRGGDGEFGAGRERCAHQRRVERDGAAFEQLQDILAKRRFVGPGADTFGGALEGLGHAGTRRGFDGDAGFERRLHHGVGPSLRRLRWRADVFVVVVTHAGLPKPGPSLPLIRGRNQHLVCDGLG